MPSSNWEPGFLWRAARSFSSLLCLRSLHESHRMYFFAGCIYLRGELCPEKQDNSLIVESNSGFKSVGCCLAVSTTGHSNAALKLPICFKALV